MLKQKPHLDYLFAAEFTDGTFFRQTQEDKSKIDNTKNCFFDLQEQTKDKKTIRRFSVVGKGNTVTVDLGTGLFYINALPVILESKALPTLPDKFELIWYHQVSKYTNVTYDKETGEPIKFEDQPEHREYFIGWKCNIKGKSYEQKIGVS